MISPTTSRTTNTTAKPPPPSDRRLAPMAPSYGEALTSQSASVGRSGLVRCRVHTHGMHIVEANDWKDAAITLLEPHD